METTIDGLLNRRVALEQPKRGYRVAVDTVLLAASVPAAAGEQILDLGCGVGGAMLCLAARVAGLRGLGIDIQDGLIEICRRNIARNPFAAGLAAQAGDAVLWPAALCNQFDHVLANPPFHDTGRHDASPDAIRRTANADQGNLAAWIAAAMAALKPLGMLTLIHRADRQDEILAELERHFGALEILPLLPQAGQAAKRIVIRACKDTSTYTRRCRPLILHERDGRFTPVAEAILREAQPVMFEDGQ